MLKALRMLCRSSLFTLLQCKLKSVKQAKDLNIQPVQDQLVLHALQKCSFYVTGNMPVMPS